MAKSIPLTRGMFTIVDDEDYEFLSNFSWLAHREGKSAKVFWAMEKKSKKRMHRLLVNASRGKKVIHINGNTLDNRKENLHVQLAWEPYQMRKRKQILCMLREGKTVMDIARITHAAKATVRKVRDEFAPECKEVKEPGPHNKEDINFNDLIRRMTVWVDKGWESSRWK